MTEFPPLLLAQWHPTKNDNTLASYSPYSKQIAHWKCDQNHEWEARIAHRVYYLTDCPYCTNRKILVGYNDLETKFPKIAEEWDHTKNSKKLSEMVYGSGYKAHWKCSKEHEWEEKISNRTLTNKGCPYCSGVKTIIGETDLATINPRLAKEYSPNNKIDIQTLLPYSSKKVEWVCSEGHTWNATIAHRSNGTNCPICANQLAIKGVNDFATLHPGYILNQWHPANTIRPDEIVPGSGKQILWICDEGHEWETTITTRLKGSGCPFCSKNKVLTGFNDLATTHPELVKEWSTQNIISPSSVIGNKDMKVLWICSGGHEWEATIWKRKQGSGCPRCKISNPEKEIFEYLTNLGLTVVANSRKILNGLELDFYLPDQNIAIEFNGLYWHTEQQGKDKNYHANKYASCQLLGIQLIQIWEDDWNSNKDLIKHMIAYKAGVTQRQKIYARETYVKEISKEDSRTYLNEHHIQGAVDGRLRLGLFTKKTDELVALIVLKNDAGSEGKVLNLLRYTTSASVIGGFTKLMSHVEMSNPGVEEIITFSDNTVSEGALYKNTGFVANKALRPDYMYVHKGKRYHKFGYRLVRFRTDPELKYVEGYTETQLARLNNIPRIWDAGKTRWVKKVNQ